MNSIRQRLLFWQITALVITCVLVSALTYQLAWQAFNRERDFAMEQIAHSVVRHGVRPGSWATNPPAAPATANDLGRFISQIWSPGGEILYSSVPGTGPPLQPAGFHEVAWSGESWHVYTLVDPQQIVQVAKTSSDRATSFGQLAPWLLVPTGLLVLVLSTLIHAAVTRALLPLNQLGRDIHRRDEKDLNPLPTRDLPQELTPLAEALNQLLRRVDGLLTRQRQVLADAAHELNTPLAAVKLQAQLARRSNDVDREAALDELDKGIERSTHLVAQLLQMARLERDMHQRHPVPLRCDQMAAEVVGAFSARADARRIDLGLEPSDAATVCMDPEDFRVLLNNLVDNALRHTPLGSQVDIQVQQVGERVMLTVNDNGPGIAQAERARALQRFVRLNPHDTTGSGLGLAIVTQIAEHNGGGIELRDRPGGGLSVSVHLPAHRTAPGQADQFTG
ncbi:ATP-binding protein [Hydrogenophaga sp.]|uniref:sensor histidine kinase n=1 Tax=Hydrogenophaga sp. TaxID=1904254 RepID=UPI003F7131CB